MTERYDQDMVLAYLEGELPEAQRAQFEAQLAQDDRLRRLVEQLQQDRTALRGVAAEEPPDHLLDDVNEQLARRMLLGPVADEPVNATRHHRGRRITFARTLIYSGLAAVLLLSTAVVFQTLTDTSLLDEASRYAELAAQSVKNEPARRPRGERLADASRGQAARRSGSAASEPAEPAETTGETLAMAGEDKVGLDAPPSQPEPAETPLAGVENSDQLAAAFADAPKLFATLDEADVADERSPVTMLNTAGGAASPEARIEVATRSPDRTQRDLLAWARANRVDVTPDVEPQAEPAWMQLVAPAQTMSTAEPQQLRQSRANLAEAPQATSQAVTVLQTGQRQVQDQSNGQQRLLVRLTRSQLPQLVDHLREPTGQRVVLVNVTLDESEARRTNAEEARALGAMATARLVATDELVHAEADAEQQTQSAAAFGRADVAERVESDEQAPAAQTPIDTSRLIEAQLPLEAVTPLRFELDEAVEDGDEDELLIPVIIEQENSAPETP